jgi:hypothetical protein
MRAQPLTGLREHTGPDLPNFNLGVSASLGEEEWGDPIPPLARELAAQAPLLCFDEFQVRLSLLRVTTQGEDSTNYSIG